jgi:hypothetical protein
MALTVSPVRRARSPIEYSPDDLAAAYKQLIAVERGWRDLAGLFSAIAHVPRDVHASDRALGFAGSDPEWTPAADWRPPPHRGGVGISFPPGSLR